MRTTAIAVLIALNFYYVLSEPIARVRDGAVRGTILKSRNGRLIEAYLGIPYAEPPVGPLRFEDPVPKKRWNGILDTSKEHQQCIQLSTFFDVDGVEDCLYLHVYTPRIKTRLLPVMVFIHGGGFLMGNGSKQVAGPDYLMDKDIVFVTIDYRLGPLGFLSTGDSVSPGNYGLKDQQLALKWVKENILAFGGNPTQITLFGESAGSVSVHLHSMNKESQKYIGKYITESGVAFCPWALRTHSSYFDRAKKLASDVNCPTSNSTAMVNCFKQLPATTLMSAKVFTDLEYRLLGGWGPAMDSFGKNPFIPENPVDIMKRNEIKQAPIITGSNEDEGLFGTIYFYKNQTMLDEFEKDPIGVLQFMLEHTSMPFKTKNFTKLAEKVKNYYLGDMEHASRDKILEGLTKFYGDYGFVYPQQKYIDYLQNFTQPIYHYLFNYLGTLSFSWPIINESFGVSHADELIYLFPIYSDAFDSPNDIPQNAADHAMSYLMVDLWTSFATYSVPISHHLNGTHWFPRGKRDNYLEIGLHKQPQSILKSGLFHERMKFMDDLYNYQE